MFLMERGAMANNYPIERYLDLYTCLILALATVLSIGLRPWLRAKWTTKEGETSVMIGREVYFWTLLIVSLISVGAASYSPFIYFRF